LEIALMTKPIDALGLVGLGKMGADLAKNALAKGYAVAGTDTHADTGELTKAGMKAAKDLKQLVALLTPPRFVMIYVPAGPPVDDVIDELAAQLAPGDIIADGGNSYWGDSIRRHARLKQKGIHFIDAGTSGGPEGALDGACFMLGGEDEPVAAIEPMLRKLAVAGGFVHAGGPGAGHYVKLVHNGIEFGMLQAIGEGMELLEHFREPLPVSDVLKCWQHGSVIRSWLIDLMEKTYTQQGGLEKVPSYVEDTGEVNWLVDDALHMEVPIPVITQSVIQLVASRDRDRESSRAVAMMRHGFGGHPYGPAKNIAHERHTGRIGPFVGKAGNGAAS
jgi:6-phosphogluconate dehydrogenase